MTPQGRRPSAGFCGLQQGMEGHRGRDFGRGSPQNTVGEARAG